MLEDIKLILGIDYNDSDAILTLMIKDATQAILNYCHLIKLPLGLEYLVRDVIIQQFNIQNEGNITSVKRGDTQVSYGAAIGIETYTDRQKSTLNSYRKWIAR